MYPQGMRVPQRQTQQGGKGEERGGSLLLTSGNVKALHGCGGPFVEAARAGQARGYKLQYCLGLPYATIRGGLNKPSSGQALPLNMLVY